MFKNVHSHPNSVETYAQGTHRFERSILLSKLYGLGDLSPPAAIPSELLGPGTLYTFIL